MSSTINSLGSPTPVTAPFGGTGDSTLTAHAVLIGEGTGAINELTVGTNGQVLVGSSAADPVFATLTSSSLTYTTGAGSLAINITAPVSIANGGTNATSMANTDGVAYFDGTRIVVSAAGTTGQVFTGVTSGAPGWASPAASSISITGNSGGALVSAAFTFTGGTTGLTFAGSGSTETLGGTLVVANGGTGAATLTGVLTGNGTSAITANTVTQHGVLLGGATNAVSSLGVASTGATLMGATGADPAFTGSPSFSGSVTAATTITATSGAITATSGNFVLTAATTSSVGQIVQAGTRILHTFGTNNIFVGSAAGALTGGTASQCVALGAQALATALANGTANCIAIGYQALNLLNGNIAGGGSHNLAIGSNAGGALLTGKYNTLIGAANCGINYVAAESSNILIGAFVSGTASESNVLRVGTGTGTGNGNLNKAIICGIQGITVTGTAILISASDQLGIAVSSERYKENIKDLEHSRVLELQPKSFNYKVGDDRSPQTGLIAEEVYEIMPELVVLDKEGLPQTVKYHDLGTLLLVEIKKLNKRISQLELKS